MVEFFSSLDRSLFYVGNHTIQNPLFDILMPFLTNLNRKPFGIALAILLWLFLLVRGGTYGRIAALLLLPAIAFGDQLNSFVLKFLVERPRPCHVLPNVHLLVSCGSGYSFPSSHAVNNFAGGLVLSYFIPRWTWAFFGFALLVAVSRVYVGVHYPSDIAAGALVGLCCASTVIVLFNLVSRLVVRPT